MKASCQAIKSLKLLRKRRIKRRSLSQPRKR